MFASDTFKSNVISLRGNKYVQLFCNRGNYVASYPMKKKSHAFHTLERFLHEIGIPIELLTDGAKELILGEWGKICRKHGIYQVTTEPHSPWQNPAEKCGGLVKRKVKHMMETNNAPVVLWDYCWEYVSAIRSIVAVNNAYLDDVSPFQKVHGYPPNITEYTLFPWYDWVEYNDYDNHETSCIGRWLGPAHNVGQGYAHYILSSSGKVVTRSTVIPISESDRASASMKERMELHTKNVESLIGNFSQSTLNNSEERNEAPYDVLFEDDQFENIEPQELDDLGNPVIVPDIDVPHDDEAFVENDDEMVGLKIPIERGGEVLEGTVKQRKRRADGSLVGTAHSNKTLDTRMYEVEFPDGSYNEYSTNVLVENLFAHVDDNGMHHSMLKGIINHRKDHHSAVSKEFGTYRDKHGVTKKIITTRGWDLKVEWSDGTCSWVPLSVMKESNPLECAQYAKSRKIEDEPAFAWWSPYVLKKVKAIVKATTHRKVCKKI